MTEDLGLFQLTWLFFTLIVMGKWLLRNNWGKTALDGCELPENEFNPADAAIAFAMFFGFLLFSNLLISEDSAFENKMIVTSSISFAASLVMLAFLNKRLKDGVGPLFKKNPVMVIGQAIIYSIPAICLSAIVFFITILICRVFGYDQVEKHQYLEEVFGAGNPETNKVILLYVSAGIVTPLIEETLFRGLLQNILSKAIGMKWPAIFIAASFFALMHGNVQHWPALFVLGSFFGYTMIKTRSLAVPMVMHAIFNCYSITNSLLSEMSKQTETIQALIK